MNHEEIRKILEKTDCVRFSGSSEEKEAAAYLEGLCRDRGVHTYTESFEVDTAEMHRAELMANGQEIPCEGYRLCGSGSVEAPLCYLPNMDPASLPISKCRRILLSYIRIIAEHQSCAFISTIPRILIPRDYLLPFPITENFQRIIKITLAPAINKHLLGNWLVFCRLIQNSNPRLGVFGFTISSKYVIKSRLDLIFL